jgi:hypothetical protein
MSILIMYHYNTILIRFNIKIIFSIDFLVAKNNIFHILF